MVYRCFMALLLANYTYSSPTATTTKVINAPGTEVKHSIAIKFDFIFDENINQDDPRIKSVVYCARSYAQSNVEISYFNPNARDAADKLGLVMTKLGIRVLKPKQLANDTINEPSRSRYVLVKINYK